MLRVSVLSSALIIGLAWLTAISNGSETPLLLEELLRYEAQLVEATEREPSSTAFGSDPFSILRMTDGRRKLILLRNESEILLLDHSFEISDRAPAPRSPRGWTLVDDRYLFVAGELSNHVLLYEVNQGQLSRKTEFAVVGSAGFRDITYVPSSQNLFLIDTLRRRLIQLALAPDWREGNRAFHRREYPIGAGALHLEYAYGNLFLNLLLDHRIEIIPLTQAGPDFPSMHRIVHDGPIWGFDVTQRDNELLVAAVGVEDRPLDRTRGEFGYIDSFLFLYRISGKDPKHRSPQPSPHPFAVWNLSAHNIVTPKRVQWRQEGHELMLWVLAYGSDRGAVWTVDNFNLSIKKIFQAPPGTTDFLIEGANRNTRIVATNTLLDQVFELDPDDPYGSGSRAGKTSLPNDYPSQEARTGELLFFTTLFSPKNQSEGQLSRFTCEACHFEGTIDGRVHYTGRGSVFATTKTLRGLANNVPLFSRAGDRSLASMVVAEFRVANQKRQDDFTIDTSEYPWMEQVNGLPERLPPLELRKSFLSFFVFFGHQPNAWMAVRRRLTPSAVKGLEVFRARCEYCHLAIPSTRREDALEFRDWQTALEDAAIDLVWGAPFYTKTNILPYVSKKGARVPSLRRVGEKYPYFTNGSSRDLRGVLERFRYRGATAWHHYDGPNAADIEPLSSVEIDQLEELLRYF